MEIGEITKQSRFSLPSFLFVAIGLLLSTITLAYRYGFPPVNVQRAYDRSSRCRELTDLDLACSAELGLSALTSTLLSVGASSILCSVLAFSIAYCGFRWFGSGREVRSMQKVSVWLVAIPGLAWLPLVLWTKRFFGLDVSDLPVQILFVFLGAFPFGLARALESLDEHGEKKLQVILRRYERNSSDFFRFVLPSIAPQTIQGLRFAVVISFVLSVVYGSIVIQTINLGTLMNPFNESGVRSSIDIVLLVLLVGLFGGIFVDRCFLFVCQIVNFLGQNARMARASGLVDSIKFK